MKTRKPAPIKAVPQTCNPTEHAFSPVDITPLVLMQPGSLGAMEYQYLSAQERQFKIFCIKCGQVRTL